MRVTIVREDGWVSVDGEGYSGADLTAAVPDDVHAVQWFGDRGEIEFSAVRCSHCGVVSKKPNESINSFDRFTSAIDAWRVAKDAAAARAEAEAEDLRRTAEASDAAAE